jgi:site-specific DNA-cytosine methylase
MRNAACCQVSHAAQAAGFQPVCGVEMDAVAASSFCANLPAAGGNEMPLQEFLAALRQGEAGMPGGLSTVAV